jgi:hypothetical protein
VQTITNLMSSGDIQRAYAAFALVCIAAMGIFSPQSTVGIGRLLSIVKRRVSAPRQAQFERILVADYGDRERSNRISYAVSGVALVLAVLCAVPAVPAGIPLALGIMAAAGGIVAGFMRRKDQSARRAATLTPRGLPRTLVIIGICDVVATMWTAIDPALRWGSLLVALTIAGMLAFARYASAAPAPLRGNEPALENAVADFVRADQMLSITMLIMGLAGLNFLFCLLYGEAMIHTLGRIGTTEIVLFCVVRWGPIIPLSVATFVFRAGVKRLRDVEPLVTALEAAPA